MEQSITYFAISPSQLDRAIREANSSEEFATAETICVKFGIKPNMLESMAKNREITKHKVGDHRKPTLYSVDEVRKKIKPII